MSHQIYGSLYVARSPSGKIYVGISTDWKKRWNTHVRQAGNGRKSPLSAAIRKYGRDGFTVLELIRASWEQLNRLEAAMIAALRCQHPHGYNLLSGGNQPLHHEESRRKMSASARGRSMSPGAVAKMVASHRGKHLSEEVKNKIRQSKLGRPLSTAHRKKISESMMGNSNRSHRQCFRI